MRKTHLIILLATFFVYGCDSDDNQTEPIEVKSKLIGKGKLLGDGGEGIGEQNLIIKDKDSWNRLMVQMDSVNSTTDNFSEKDIDFSSFQVIAVFDEIKSTGGHYIKLEMVQNLNNIIVNIEKLAPTGGATTSVTQPFIIVKIPNSVLPVIFQ